MEKETLEKDCHCENDCKCQESKHNDHQCNEAESKKEYRHKDKDNKKLKEKIELLDQEKKALEEKVKYHQAELINYRKRKDEEVSNLLKYSNQDLILEIIPVLDNFERAIKLDDNNLNDELSKFLDGFKMMYVHLSDILKRYGVEEIDCLGKDFDPNLEEALMIDADETKPDNIVLEVLLKGYKLKDRVIRPSAVKVNKINNKDKGEDNNE